MSQLDCAPQLPNILSVPLAGQTSLPPASIQGPAPILQTPVTMTKVSVIYVLNCLWKLAHINQTLICFLFWSFPSC